MSIVIPSLLWSFLNSIKLTVTDITIITAAVSKTIAKTAPRIMTDVSDDVISKRGTITNCINNVVS